MTIFLSLIVFGATLLLVLIMFSLMLADELRKLLHAAALDYLQIRTAARMSDVDIEHQQIRLLVGGE